MLKKNDVLFQFSPSVFWDVSREKFNIRKDKADIIERVMTYGLETDEILLYKLYSFDTIKKIAVNLQGLNRKTISYLSCVFDLDAATFKSYNKVPWYERDAAVN